MGGRGSGGHNRLPAEVHVRRGNFRPSRHLGKLVALPIDRAIPPVPDGLVVEGAGGLLWKLLWTHATFLSELDSDTVYDACKASDLQAMAIRKYEVTLEAKDLKAVEAATRTKQSLLAALGVGAVDRVKLGLLKVDAVSKLDLLRRKSSRT